MYRRTYKYIHINLNIYMYIYVCLYIYMHVCVCIYLYIYKSTKQNSFHGSKSQQNQVSAANKCFQPRFRLSL